jgi:hypothetical protein
MYHVEKTKKNDKILIDTQRSGKTIDPTFKDQYDKKINPWLRDLQIIKY